MHLLWYFEISQKYVFKEKIPKSDYSRVNIPNMTDTWYFTIVWEKTLRPLTFLLILNYQVYLLEVNNQWQPFAKTCLFNSDNKCLSMLDMIYLI